jgi:hypothetical protein
VLPRHIEVNKATGIVARAAAAFAVASTILKDVDSLLSQRSLDAGTRAWTWIEQNPDHFEFDNLPSWRTGSTGTVLGAAVELARATGEQKYFSYADSIISLGTFYNFGYWAKDTAVNGPGKFAGQLTNVWLAHMDEASYGQAPVALARYYNVTHNPAIKTRIKNLCQDYVNHIKTACNNPFEICESMFESWWGFVPNNTDLAKCLLEIGIEVNLKEAVALAQKQYEWTVGFNPLGTSCIVGFGNPGFQPEICERSPDATIGGLLPGMILLNGELSTYYGPYNQWSICEVGESSAVLFDLLAGFNKFYNPTDSSGELPDSIVLHPSSFHSIPDHSGNFFSLFPNPASDEINLFYEFTTGSNVEFLLCSIDSRNRRVFTSENKEGRYTIDLSPYSEGFYLLVMKIDGQIIDHKSFNIVR